MTRIFKDESGQEFELITVGSGGSLNTGDVVIRPIKAVEKHRYMLTIRDDLRPVDNLYGNIIGDISEPTAQKVAEAVEAWLHYITNPKDVSGKTPSYESDMDKAIGLSIDARKAFREDV